MGARPGRDQLVDAVQAAKHRASTNQLGYRERGHPVVLSGGQPEELLRHLLVSVQLTAIERERADVAQRACLGRVVPVRSVDLERTQEVLDAEAAEQLSERWQWIDCRPGCVPHTGRCRAGRRRTGRRPGVRTATRDRFSRSRPSRSAEPQRRPRRARPARLHGRRTRRATAVAGSAALPEPAPAWRVGPASGVRVRAWDPRSGSPRPAPGVHGPVPPAIRERSRCRAAR
ncbi:hypothetical protein EV652_104333 [Kribbella steppae]|uniref:Uncharacterized protein n=1 Tax=Kribbella steppae TaxID=2512223 RepID=A0A4R2HNV6_9ACTN|nr:hypothetical protein EV652_104333 [Kribbella steppae]